jgi:DNA-directed RNA polymerase subunit RPC12/RpoP
MAIRVIKKKPDRSVLKTIVCDNCGVTLEYTPKDVKTRNVTDYSGGSDGEEYIRCPECKEKVIIN